MTLATEHEFVSKKAAIIFPGIEFIGHINKKGRMTEAIGHYASKLPEEKKEMFLMSLALSHAMQRDFDEDIEPVDYVLTKRGNTKFISIPTSINSTILAIAKDNVEHERVVKSINQVLRCSEMFLGEKFVKV